MGISTKLYIRINQNTSLEVVNSTFEVIDKGIKSLFPNGGRDFRENHIEQVRFSPKNPFLFYSLGFKLNGDRRNLYIMFDAEVDTKKIFEGQSISFSLNYWGQSVEIMEAIAKEILTLPFAVEAYLLKDDSTDNYRVL